jgi:hypothetical protein
MQTGSYSFVPVEKIIWGVPADEALRPQVEERGARRIPQYCDGTSRSIETSSANLRKRQEIPAGRRGFLERVARRIGATAEA